MGGVDEEGRHLRELNHRRSRARPLFCPESQRSQLSHCRAWAKPMHPLWGYAQQHNAHKMGADASNESDFRAAGGLARANKSSVKTARRWEEGAQVDVCPVVFPGNRQCCARGREMKERQGGGRGGEEETQLTTKTNAQDARLNKPRSSKSRRIRTEHDEPYAIQGMVPIVRDRERPRRTEQRNETVRVDQRTCVIPHAPVDGDHWRTGRVVARFHT